MNLLREVSRIWEVSYSFIPLLSVAPSSVLTCQLINHERKITYRYGISTALNSIIDDLRLTAPFKVIFQNTCDQLEELPPLQQSTLLRIIQEQSRNIIKHAHASYVHISLAFQGNTIVLEIKDDGIDFNQKHVPLGMGLVSIADRVKLCKGKLEIKSPPCQGTRLSVLLPRSI